MARKKPRFRCHKCKKNLGSAAKSFGHFQKNPTHRTERQIRDYKTNIALRKQKALHPIAKLPTVSASRGSKKAVRPGRYCTHCGEGRKAFHRFCGHCAEKLA